MWNLCSLNIPEIYVRRVDVRDALTSLSSLQEIHVVLTMIPSEVKNDILQLNETLPLYLQTLVIPEQPGQFLPCVKGVKKRGRRVALGFSCFALKLYYMLGLWENLDSQAQNAWLGYLKSFQIPGKLWQNRIFRNAFLDPPVIEYLQQRFSRRERFMRTFFWSKQPGKTEKIVMAETKQALATLMQVGASADHRYLGFPQTPEAVQHAMLHTTDWSRPWGAGGYTSAIAMFIKTQAPDALGAPKARELAATCCQIYDTLADKKTGAYFTGDPPEHGQLINGAMKVLTALEWLEIPIHYPEQLIDTCLAQLPNPEGCHLVDAVYVLYRCQQQTEYRKADIQQYSLQVLGMIRQHYNADGGFSYFIGRSQTKYYGVPISKGLAESDIHGTLLLTWALVMIMKILEYDIVSWRVIRP